MIDGLRFSSQGLVRATGLIRAVCLVAGSTSFLDDVLLEAHDADLQNAINAGKTDRLFDWLVQVLSFQGISDSVARAYLRTHGSATWCKMTASLGKASPCPKLQSFWHFTDCRYDKTSGTCSVPDHLDTCGLPKFSLRNGRLNQMAFSLFFFIRDVANGDLTGWIDKQIDNASPAAHEDLLSAQQRALVEPLKSVFGASDKVVAMALSTILMSLPDRRPDWFAIGANMVVIDTLVHNFLHRTGIMHQCGRPHGYGAGCYREGGCSEIISQISNNINARLFNPRFPSRFKRFVQHAVWRFCAADGLNLCNGNRIDDLEPCEITYCYLYEKCDRLPLKMQYKSST